MGQLVKCLFFILLFMPQLLYGQTDDTYVVAQPAQVVISEPERNNAINVGVLMGGGGLVGADFEVLVIRSKFGIQVGAGLGSLGAGITYHWKPRINSSFLSLQYWRQGISQSEHFAAYVGPMFVFRAKKIFQAGIGWGYIVSKGPRWELGDNISMTLLYNIGLYFPL